MMKISAVIRFLILASIFMGLALSVSAPSADINLKRIQEIPEVKMVNVVAYQEEYWKLPNSTEDSARRVKARELVTQRAASDPDLFSRILQQAGALQPGDIVDVEVTTLQPSSPGRSPRQEIVAAAAMSAISLGLIFSAIAWVSYQIEDWKLRRKTGATAILAKRAPYLQIIWAGAAAWIAASAWVAFR